MSSEARGEVEAIRGGAEQQVGGGGRGVGRGAIEWRHQARHGPARPRLRPHLRAAPGRCGLWSLLLRGCSCHVGTVGGARIVLGCRAAVVRPSAEIGRAHV